MKKLGPFYLLVVALIATSCISLPRPPRPPDPPVEPPVQPVEPAKTYAFDGAICRTAPDVVSNYCDGPAGGTIQLNTGPNGFMTFHADGNGYVWMSGIPAELFPAPGYTFLLLNAPGYVERVVNTTISQLMAENAEGRHNMWQLQAEQPPVAPKVTFAQEYQGNFGSIKVPDCGFYNDSAFDPVVLLVTWTYNKACFEKTLKAHADRGDNRVVVDPRADYHGGQGGGVVDLWHDPATFAAYIRDIRAHVNNRGEHFKVLMFMSADAHIGSFLKNGQVGAPDIDAETHFSADARALAIETADIIDGTAICWECRHQRDYMTAGTYERMGILIARLFPQAWHGMHLKAESSSWSSWNCDPDVPPCTPATANAEGDDPARGNEAEAWRRCITAKWCDGFLYQFDQGGPYQRPKDYPNYTGYPGALGRYWEILVRLGNDPWSLALSGGQHSGWPQTDVIAFEFIYDAYNNNSDEAYGIEWCKQALAMGGWGCGSGSYRRPK